MLLNESLKQEVTLAVKKSLTFDIMYQRIRPDISPFVVATSTLPLKSLKEWERLIRREIDLLVYRSDNKQAGIKTIQIGSLSWLDLCHADGFRRERALRTLTVGAPNSFLFAIAIRKLNDWVPQVREAAREALPSIALASDPEVIANVLFITLPYWNSWGRAGEKERRVLTDIISIENVTTSLKKKLICASSGPAATVFTQAGRTSVLDNFLSEIAESCVQPSLRARVYRCLFEGKIVWSEGLEWQWIDKAFGVRRRLPVLKERTLTVSRPFIETLRLAIVDRSPMVRRIAGEMLIKELENMNDEAFTMATQLAADISESVAERGRFALACLEKAQ
ncbi:hypothetical protein [Pantoea sp. R13S299]|uniref:hypothetical protein n=1 Tax=Pantoea sp. R13S299 TaxID=3402751 RepID=UPI003ADA5B7D